MKKFFYSVLALLLVVSFVVATNDKVVMGWGSTGGDAQSYNSLQETGLFFNNSGDTLSAGDVVILDTSGTGVTAGTTLGAYVTTTTSADSALAIGVVKSTSVADQTPVVVVTKGPVDARCRDGTDAVTSGSAVGTAAVTKQCGGGSELGVALEAGAGIDFDKLFIWVNPSGSD